jgi:hypothetical protein
MHQIIHYFGSGQIQSPSFGLKRAEEDIFAIFVPEVLRVKLTTYK